MSVAASVLRGFTWIALWYFVLLNTSVLVSIALAAAGTAGARRRGSFAVLAEVFHSPLAPPVSVVVPARDVGGLIVGTARGLLNLRYPEYEVIIVDDGSADDTFARLRREFRLVEVDKVIRGGLAARGAVRSVHMPSSGERLLVIRKERAGGLADALNTGVNAARYPLICRVGAGTCLEETALLSAARPFIEDPARMAAVTAPARVANGCRLSGGLVTGPGVPDGWLLPVQAAEYLRVFLLDRAGWAQLRELLFDPGAFAVIRREIYELAGGFPPDSEGGDLELTTSLRRWLLEAGRPFRICSVPEPCCWATAPSGIRQLADQRVRWSRVTIESLWAHRPMLFNPRYRGTGLLVLPLCLAFELVSGVMELLAVVALVAGWATGILSPATVVVFLIAVVGYGAFLSVVSVITEELAYHRYRSARDFALLLFGAVAGNVGFRQLCAWWRLRGIAAALWRRRAAWLQRPAGAQAGMAAGTR